MKHLTLAALCGALLLPLGAGATSPPVAAKPAGKPAVAKPAVAKLKISGMDCEGCAGGLVTKLKGLKGVQSAKVEFKKALGTVTYDPKVRKPTDFVAAAKEAGFLAKLLP